MDRATAQQVNQTGTGLAALRAQLRAATLRPEADASGELLADLSVARAALERAATRAARWVETARADRRSRPLVDRMLEQFPLDSAQGKALMSLAEALLQSMQLLGHAFIVGETIDAALARGRSEPGLALCSFDVLGEGARTESDAQRYYDSYAHAIGALGAQAAASVHARSGISVKLSALEPRYTQLQSARVNEQLGPRMLELARRAARAGIGFTVDAEEADRLDLS